MFRSTARSTNRLRRYKVWESLLCILGRLIRVDIAVVPNLVSTLDWYPKLSCR